MSRQRITAVVGRGFGDEGKGMAVDWLCGHAPGALVIRHNGGAQAGHTVEHPGFRFVFHQLSSGSFHRADTFWADTFLPDLYKLGEEAEAFRAAAGFLPTIHCDPQARAVLIDDVIINMGLETLRGAGRHGSCGMGINEADLRARAGFGLTVGEILSCSAEGLAARMLDIRRAYQPRRLAELRIRRLPGEFQSLLESRTVIENAAEEICRNRELLTPAAPEGLLSAREQLVFEGAQGLLLDAECARYAPHVTASRTGLVNPVRLLARCGLHLDEVVYVARSYVTRHGAGPLPCEQPRELLGIAEEDRTNTPNPWQGAIRYAPYPSPEAMMEPIAQDLAGVADPRPQVSLLITHLNETCGRVLFAERSVPAGELPRLPAFDGAVRRFYRSDSRYASGIRAIDMPGAD